MLVNAFLAFLIANTAHLDESLSGTAADAARGGPAEDTGERRSRILSCGEKLRCVCWSSRYRPTSELTLLFGQGPRARGTRRSRCSRQRWFDFSHLRLCSTRPIGLDLPNDECLALYRLGFLVLNCFEVAITNLCQGDSPSRRIKLSLLLFRLLKTALASAGFVVSRLRRISLPWVLMRA